MRNYSNIISFPGLGIGEFTVNNVAFSVFGIDIAWYGIIITAGMIIAFCYASWRAVKYEKIKFDDMLDYAIWIILCGVSRSEAVLCYNGRLALYPEADICPARRRTCHIRRAR